MPREEDGSNWLDDAFDDRKNEEALLAAQKASNRSCLLVVAIGAVGIIAILVAGFGLLLSLS